MGLDAGWTPDSISLSLSISLSPPPFLSLPVSGASCLVIWFLSFLFPQHEIGVIGAPTSWGGLRMRQGQIPVKEVESGLTWFVETSVRLLAITVLALSWCPDNCAGGRAGRGLIIF